MIESHTDQWKNDPWTNNKAPSGIPANQHVAQQQKQDPCHYMNTTSGQTRKNHMVPQQHNTWCNNRPTRVWMAKRHLLAETSLENNRNDTWTDKLMTRGGPILRHVLAERSLASVDEAMACSSVGSNMWIWRLCDAIHSSLYENNYVPEKHPSLMETFLWRKVIHH